MVALRDRDSEEELTGLACQLATGMNADIVALHIIEIPMATPLTATGEAIEQEGKEVLAQASRVAGAGVSVRFSTKLIRARNAGDAIVAEATDQGIDLLIVGHHRQHELSEFLLGSTARHVAHHATCRVIVQIPAPKSPKTQAAPEGAAT